MLRRLAFAHALALVAASVSGCAPSPAPAGWQGSAYQGPPGASEPGSEPGSDSASGSASGSDSASGSASGSDSASGSARVPAGMTAFEAGVAAAVNRLRRDPAGLAAELERHRRNYHDNYLYLPGVDAPILTVEGVKAVDEAIAAARYKPLPQMRLSAGLCRAARGHAVEIGRAGTVDHVSRDGSEPFERMRRQGGVHGLAGENIGTGWGDADNMVLSLFIDDGVRDRGHRTNLLEPEYAVLGVGCAPHRRFGTVCVLDLAAGFRD